MALLRMRAPPPLLLLLSLLLLLVSGAAAQDNSLSVQVPAGEHVCFYEDLPRAGTKVFMHFLVTTGASLDIHATVSGPDKQVIWQAGASGEERVLFKTRQAGRHSFCFVNTMWGGVGKIVTFSVLVGDTADAMQSPSGGVGGDNATATANKTPQDSLQRALRRIREGLTEIANLQSYLRIRERQHRSTTEVANTRVVVWSIVEMVVIVVMGVASVLYLRRLFTTKRYV